MANYRVTFTREGMNCTFSFPVEYNLKTKDGLANELMSVRNSVETKLASQVGEGKSHIVSVESIDNVMKID